MAVCDGAVVQQVAGRCRDGGGNRGDDGAWERAEGEPEHPEGSGFYGLRETRLAKRAGEPADPRDVPRRRGRMISSLASDSSAGCAVTGDMRSQLSRRAPTGDIDVGSRNGCAPAGARQIGSHRRGSRMTLEGSRRRASPGHGRRRQGAMGAFATPVGNAGRLIFEMPPSPSEGCR